MRISLRNLLIVVAAISVLLALTHRWDARARRQHAATTQLTADTINTVRYQNGLDPETDLPWIAKLLPGALNFDHFCAVTSVDLSDPSDDQLSLLHDFPHIEELSIFWATQCSSAGLAQIRRLTSLECLYLSDAPAADDKVLAAVGQLKRLKLLQFECGAQSTDAGLGQLARLSKLRSLSLKCGPRTTDTGVDSISRLKNLSSLSLDFDDATNLTIEFTNSPWLGISYDQPIRGLRFEYLDQLKQLTTLHIRGNGALSTDCLRNLQGLPDLTTLRIEATAGTDDHSLTLLGKLQHLQTLVLKCGTGTETDHGIAQLSHGFQLRRLEVVLGPAVTDAGLAKLAACENLGRMILHLNDQVTGKGIAALDRLQYLEIDTTRSSNQSPIQLCLPRDLQELVLNGKERITDDDLSALLTCRELRRVDLFYCKRLTDRGLEQLASLTPLNHLGIHWCDQITEAAVTKLRTALPNCKITVSKGGGSFGFSKRF